jgi:prepilin-type N-terminal cleavage/methylation domain-containing protein
MRVIRQTSERRPAFTLIELVVVIAIILALAGILLSAVYKAVGFADELKNTNDIRQLDVAIQLFKSKFNVDYVPSKLFLSNNSADYLPTLPAKPTPTQLLNYDSAQYLRRLWPRITFPVSWSPNTTLPGPWTLEGNQCLVFFLGGIPTVTATGVFKCNGFSTNSADPTNLSVSSGTMPPFYDFSSDRLHVNPAVNPPTTTTTFIFFDYLDPYGKLPYAYFSAYKSANNYDRYSMDRSGASPAWTTFSDCSGLGVWPYATDPLALTSINNYLNPSTHQIISAGKKAKFGSGVPPSAVVGWKPATASDFYPPGSDGADDQANFHNRTLGIPSP